MRRDRAAIVDRAVLGDRKRSPIAAADRAVALARQEPEGLPEQVGRRGPKATSSLELSRKTCSPKSTSECRSGLVSARLRESRINRILAQPLPAGTRARQAADAFGAEA